MYQREFLRAVFERGLEFGDFAVKMQRCGLLRVDLFQARTVAPAGQPLKQFQAR